MKYRLNGNNIWLTGGTTPAWGYGDGESGWGGF
jgi:hypothetical protein